MDISISSLMLRGPPAITTSYSLVSDDQGCTGSKAEKKHSENEHFEASELWEIYPDVGVGPDSHLHSIDRPEPSVPAVSC